MRLQVAINGARHPSSHHAIARSLEELGADAASSVAAGAESVHFHIRDNAGVESLHPEMVARCVREMRKHVGVPVGISTGIWIHESALMRERLVAGWTVMPDFASVNFDEESATELARLLRRHGVAIEAGLSSVEAAKVFAQSGCAAHSLRVLFEPESQDVDAALEVVVSMEDLLTRSNDAPVPRLLHGTDATTWPLLDHAITRGWATRIGFEDTLRKPDGALAPSNTELVRIAVARLASEDLRRSAG